MAWWKVFLDRLRALRDSDAVHREIDEEVRFHLDMRTEENLRRGMSPEDARREAERRFGRLTRITLADVDQLDACGGEPSLLLVELDEGVDAGRGQSGGDL